MANENIARAAGALGITVADFNQLPQLVRDNAVKMLQSNDALTAAVSGDGKFSLTVGEKGTIVMRGFGRFPHSFYVEQSDRLFDWIHKGGGYETYTKFRDANKDKLKTKAAAIQQNAAG